MITRKELVNCITECENAQPSYQNCEKLATFYTIFDHLYEDSEQKLETQVEDYGDSEFLKAIKGKPTDEMWLIMDELMDALQITNPRLYESVMRKLR